ncbi:MAG: PA14 domain-containing protein, partial [Nitrospirota bacterium]|nr:PA14 domain-containing protein [Nitrospirota bacterium]
MRKFFPVLFLVIIVTCAVVGSASAQVMPVVPRGITGYYYNNAEPERASITGPYYHKTVDPGIHFRTATLDWKPLGLVKKFSVYWNGWVYIDETKTYSFSVMANGGAELYIDEIKFVKKVADPGKRWMSSA